MKATNEQINRTVKAAWFLGADNQSIHEHKIHFTNCVLDLTEMSWSGDQEYINQTRKSLAIRYKMLLRQEQPVTIRKSIVGGANFANYTKVAV